MPQSHLSAISEQLTGPGSAGENRKGVTPEIKEDDRSGGGRAVAEETQTHIPRELLNAN